MSTHVLQTILVAVIVLASAILAARQVAPGPWRVLQTSLARALGRSQRASMLRSLGHWLQPDEAKQGSCGSGAGCASCKGCAASGLPSVESLPLHLAPREFPRP